MRLISIVTKFMPTHFYPQVFGETGQLVMEIYDSLRASQTRDNNLTRPEIAADSAEIDSTKIWEVKGPQAPGAIDMYRRVEVLDAMGVDRQLVFPTFGFIAFLLASVDKAVFGEFFATDCPPNLRQIGLDGIRAHNDWVLTLGDLRERERHVAIIPTFDLDEMLRETERVVTGGAEALWITATVPPSGTSPANEKIDAFWSLAEESGVSVTVHLNGEPFLPSGWSDAQAFRRQFDSILPQGAYFMTTFSLAVEHYLTSMVIGGVFERHPRLRLGIIECGASWLGPLCERMDMVWDYFGQTRKLSRRPTEYIADQVRVTPFFFEPVDVYLERYPQLVDVYCYSSDYPHSEGGANAMQKFHQRLESFGDEVASKFFRTNAELIVPA